MVTGSAHVYAAIYTSMNKKDKYVLDTDIHKFFDWALVPCKTKEALRAFFPISCTDLPFPALGASFVKPKKYPLDPVKPKKSPSDQSEARRVHTSLKSEGPKTDRAEKRPLTIANPRDKIIQEAFRMSQWLDDFSTRRPDGAKGHETFRERCCALWAKEFGSKAVGIPRLAMEGSGPEILEPAPEARRWSSSADVGLDSTGYKVEQSDCHGSTDLCAPHLRPEGANGTQLGSGR
ncbi:hypothetical protein AXG93_402s1500 [Marchantia polymorpha subsp. ruderalis]|uniref:Uncharacterized protein n=1 Tax=Marchantia polymorpha subsp. ruderalis TaxID=1480154 RepID=A0A176WC76_MARPO|nr:hypothetical protein AXG93_402s1500 [Marchantia polymorpha subsp. ruderalis]